jgi:glycosyltransferase involved in cell wall biosynthesis
LPIPSQLNLDKFMGKELFEVFLGTFNAEPWIEQVISSLETQDNPAFKVKIFDNSSTDNTVAIISNILSKDNLKNEYTLFTNDKNIGAISSFLDRLDQFDSDWIVMVHQDDYYHPDHISTLATALKEEPESTGIVFTAMQRIDGQGNVKISPPTLSSKLSKTNRLENFMLSLQLSPVNFPACALRKSDLQRVNTSRHTTAFNDIEILIQIMCVADVRYIPKETMHYRVYAGNAASITSSLANDRAIFVSLVELFHSKEVGQVLNQVTSDDQWRKLIESITQSVDILIKNKEIRDLAQNMISESLVRRFGYTNKHLAEFLISSLTELGLEREAKTVRNLHSYPDYKQVELLESKSGESLELAPLSIGRTPFVGRLLNLVSLPTRERFFNAVFRSRLLIGVKRPFVRVWRLRGRNG